MKIIEKNNNELIKKIKKEVSIILVGATIISTPNIVKAEKSEINRTETLPGPRNTFVMSEKGNFAINLKSQTPQESFIKKAKFLLGEDNYNNYYVNKENTSELEKEIDNKYGEGAFLRLKEFEIRINEALKDTSSLIPNYWLSSKQASNWNSIDYEARQLGIFPNTPYREHRENRIYTLELENNVIDNIISNPMNEYTTLFEMNEFVTSCVNNAVKNGEYNDPKETFEYYTNNILDPIVIRIIKNGFSANVNATATYPEYNNLKNTVFENNMTYTIKLIKTK